MRTTSLLVTNSSGFAKPFSIWCPTSTTRSDEIRAAAKSFPQTKRWSQLIGASPHFSHICRPERANAEAARTSVATLRPFSRTRCQQGIVRLRCSGKALRPRSGREKCALATSKLGEGDVNVNCPIFFIRVCRPTFVRIGVAPRTSVKQIEN